MKLIILIALGVWCNAAPYNKNAELSPATLLRPAPINPDIPGDPKPEEKITLIGEDTKIKRDTEEDEKPTSTPALLPVPSSRNQDHDDVKQQPDKRESSTEEPQKPRKICGTKNEHDDNHQLIKRETTDAEPPSVTPSTVDMQISKKGETSGSQIRLQTKRENKAADVSSEEAKDKRPAAKDLPVTTIPFERAQHKRDAVNSKDTVTTDGSTNPPPESHEHPH